MMEYHRHLGVYGICCRGDQLLVVHKTRGPYRNRYDLPGGTIEPNETIIQAIYREFQEETGLMINVEKNIGTSEFIVKYNINGKTHIQHIAIFLQVGVEAACDPSSVSDDTAGSEWIHLADLTADNSSPLVIAAKEYIRTGNFEMISLTFEDWIVNSEKV